MAESLLIELGKIIMENLGLEAWKKIMGAADIDSQMRELLDTKTTIEATLLDADSSQDLSHSQRDVLEKLQRALAGIIDFLDAKEAKAKQKRRSFFSSSNQLVSAFRDDRKIKAMTRELNLIESNHVQFGSIVASSSSNQALTLRNELDSYMCKEMVVGRDGDKDKLVSMLLNPPIDDDIPSVASIVGMGGIGKTALARCVYDDERIVTYFNLRLWGFATQDFDVEDLLWQIVGVGGPTDDRDCTLRDLLDRLSRAVAGKRFLLVLDGVWDANILRAKFLELRRWLRVGAQGSQILITTRSDTVAKMIGTQQPYMVGDLGNDDSWLLFKWYAITQSHDPKVEAIGKEIAKMCHNVPLVIRAIGSLLAGKFTVREWSSFWNDKFSLFPSYGRSVIDILKLSFNQLSPNLKLCVAYCSLFPKGFPLEKRSLIHLWIAMGYVKVEYTNQSIEDAAEDYVSCLLERGFFHNCDKDGYVFKMHNLMHDLVLSVAGFKYKMADSDTNEFDERVCHVSFVSAPNSSWKAPPSLFKIKRLESILLNLPSSGIRRFKKIRMFPLYDTFISTFTSLRVLRMHGVGITKLTSVDKLIHLRYLDLSFNSIRKLPGSITQLVHLYLLDLSYCMKLEELPEDINKLVSLRHLNLEGCFRLRYMPKKLAMLTDLETLGCFVVGKPSASKADLACNLADLSCFKNLKGSLTIVLGDRSKDTVSEAQAVDLINKMEIESFRMEFRGSGIEDEMVLENLKPCTNLKYLSIQDYGGKRLPSWMREGVHSGFPNLVNIIIKGCKECIYVGSFGGLPHLQHLCLERLEKVEYIENGGNNDNALVRIKKHASTPLYPSLTLLHLVDIPELKGWWSVTDSAQDQGLNNKLLEWIPAFPKLEKIDLDMELVITLAKVFLPTISSLQHLTVYGKPKAVVAQTFVPSNVAAEHIDLKNYLPLLCNLRFFQNQMKVIPIEFRGMSSLESLTINKCEALEEVPEWIDTLTSLKTLTIDICPRLKSLPHEISNLSNLTSLTLRECSWELAERCEEPSGEDWPNIQHIPNIVIETAANNE